MSITFQRRKKHEAFLAGYWRAGSAGVWLSGGGEKGGAAAYTGSPEFGTGDFFGGRSSKNGPSKGANIRTSVRITFEEACFGVDKELELNLKDECETCHGSGAKPGTNPETCSKCNGKGQAVFTQQSLFGMVRNVQTCPDCRGKGKIVKEKCPDCYGSGYITRKKKIQV